MAITPFDSVDEFCTGGDKTAYTPSKRITGYTGSSNDPAFAENINDEFNIFSAAIAQHADVTNNEIIPAVDTIPSLQAQSDRNTFPVFTVFAYASDLSNLPSGWAACQGQVFNDVTYPLLYAANGSSNVLPDLREYALIGSTAAAPLSISNGTVIDHNHTAGTYVTDIDPDHSHDLTYDRDSDVDTSGGSQRVFNLAPTGSTFTVSTDNAGSHSHTVTGSSGSPVSSSTGNIPKSATCHWIVKLE